METNLQTRWIPPVNIIMPICTSCTHPLPFLYTVYQSKHNLRLEQCVACKAFADPYVEHDELMLLLDLILLKRDVFRHLLFNRGSPPRVETASAPQISVKQHAQSNISRTEVSRDKQQAILSLHLGIALTLLDGFIRWTHLGISKDTIEPTRASEAFLRILVGCITETLAFHVGVTFASFVILNLLGFWYSRRSISRPRSGVREQFRYKLIPLTIFYSSLTKLFLLILLSIWRPTSTGPLATPDLSDPSYTYPSWFSNAPTWISPFLFRALDILNEDVLDREWIVRNVLGGMATGFGLRVVLDCHPFFTTLVILTGWIVKTAVAKIVSGWGLVGNSRAGEVFLAYSIP